MASRLTREKNIELALRAFALARKSVLEAGLVVVGDGDEKKRLLNVVRSLGISKAVIFEPWTDDLASYYKTADVFLNTSLYEGYGRTLVEARTAGIPVISTDVGVAYEVGADVVDLYPHAVAKAILKYAA